MTKREIASLALKLLGIYCLIQALTFLAGVLNLVGLNAAKMDLSWSLLVVAGVLPILGYLLAGFVLLAFGDRVSEKLMHEDKVAGARVSKITTREVQTLAFSVVGIYVIATSLPDLASLLWSIAFYYRKGGPELARAGAENVWQSAIQVVVEFAVGAGLFLGSRGVSSLWFFLQKARGPKLLDADRDETSSSRQRRPRKGR